MADSVSFRVEGTAAFLAALQKAGDRAVTAGASALFQEAERIMTASKAQTPVDTGTLRASGTVAIPETHGTTVSVDLGFGGAAEAYAVIVHERLDVVHPVGNAKFLERPLAEAEAGMAERIAASMRRILGA